VRRIHTEKTLDIATFAFWAVLVAFSSNLFQYLPYASHPSLECCAQ